MDLEQQIAELERRADRLVAIVGTQRDFSLGGIAQETYKVEEGPVSEKKTMADLIAYIRGCRERLLEQRDVSHLHSLLRANRGLVDNFATFAGTALNVRDKARLLLAVKDDLLDLREKMRDVGRTRDVLQRLAALQLPEKAPLSAETLQRYRRLEARAREQNQRVVTFLDAYEQIVEAINGHLAEVATHS